MRITLTAIAALLALVACDRFTQDDKASADSLPPTRMTPPARALDSGAVKLQPVDQADESFRAFRAQLQTALERHDTTFLYGILAPEIRNSFGSDDSLAGFKRIWHMESPQSQVWTALSRVIQMGGKLQDSTFTAPYVYAFWPASIDAFSNVAVTNNAAPIRSIPADTASIVGSASYSILKFSDWKNLGESAVATDSTWALVQLPDGRPLWLQGSEVYSPVGWRAIFQKRAGQWLLVTFVAGD